MVENDYIGFIKDKLEGLEIEAPGFDALFGSEVLGEASLRQLCQQKLAGYVAEAPPFEALMPVPTVLNKRQARRSAYPLWAAGLAAAATILFFFLPTPVNEPSEFISLFDRPATLRHIPAPLRSTGSSTSTFITQRLNTPTIIQEVDEPTAPTVLLAQQVDAEDEKETSDTQGRENLEKLNPARFTSLSTDNYLSTEEAYARARVTKKRRPNEKPLAGLNLASGNRLLSFVNTNKGSNPLIAKGSAFNDGFQALEGSPVTALRTAQSSRNEWVAPANILPSSLNSYAATYSTPLNLGLSVTLPLGQHLELQTGLTYTYLFSKTEGLSGASSFTLHRELHYLGIPLRLGATLFAHNNLRVYLALGGTLEKGLFGKQIATVVQADNSTNDWTDRQRVYGLQPLANAMAGISYEFMPSFQLYFEPGTTYAFEADQPISSRTEEPFSFSLGFGLRYRLN